jgi:hypothetical protein
MIAAKNARNSKAFSLRIPRLFAAMNPEIKEGGNKSHE